jgi:hypothetical protein
VSIVQLVDAIGAYVVSALEASGVRPLNDGAVLLGAEYVDDTRAPNSVVFVPTQMNFSRSVINSMSDTQSVGQGKPARIRQRTLAQRAHVFEVHVWGAATPSNARDDFDVTEYIAETIVRCSYLLASSDSQPGPGMWIDQREASGQKSKLGHYLVFQLALQGPVVDQAVNFVPAGTRLVPTLNITTKF